ncbi:MAG TPA: hypothetical protein VKB88_32410 [Bryobacteraceae bacterium]|nr:hypothetical protein [Bryobacteraceae bacterium]
MRKAERGQTVITGHGALRHPHVMSRQPGDLAHGIVIALRAAAAQEA